VRSVFHKLAIAIFLLVIFAAADTFRGGFGSDTLFRAAAGETIAIGGKLSVSPEDLAEIRDFDPEKASTYLDTSLGTHDAEVRLLELQGRIWRGELTVGRGAAGGEFLLRVMPKGGSPDEDATIYQVRLLPDAEALRLDLPSFCERRLGIRPFWVFLSLLPLGLGCLGVSFLLSNREDGRKQAAGLGPIYRMARDKESWKIIFGLGSVHGVHDGDRLLLLDKTGKVVGDLVAEKVGPEAAHAEVDLKIDLAPGFLVARSDAPGLARRRNGQG